MKLWQISIGGAIAGPILGVLFENLGLLSRVPIDAKFIIAGAIGGAVIAPLVWKFTSPVLEKERQEDKFKIRPKIRHKASGFDSLVDVEKLAGGTARFTFDEIAYCGIINKIEYVPLGPGCINVELLSLQPVDVGPAIPDVPLNFTISCFFAEVENKPQELVVRQLVRQDSFGEFFSFRVKG